MVELIPRFNPVCFSNQTALVNIAQEQAGNAKTLFGLTEPGLQTAEDFYQSLATGDPAAIARAVAPTAQAASQAASGAKRNIEATAPAGGERNLAIEETDVNKQGVISKAASGASLGAPNALAALAGQGVGESISAAGTGISGLSAGSQTLGNLGGLEMQGQQIQAQQKGNMLGIGTSLAEFGTEAGLMASGAIAF